MTAFSFLPDTFREALAIHDLINTFGVPIENIFVMLADDKFVIVAKEGEKSFAIDAGPINLEPDEFAVLWDAAVKAYNGSSKTERAWLLDHSRARICAALIINGLVENGFTPASTREARVG